MFRDAETVSERSLDVLPGDVVNAFDG